MAGPLGGIKIPGLEALTSPDGVVARLVGVGDQLSKSLDRHSKALHANAESNLRLAASMDEQGLRQR